MSNQKQLRFRMQEIDRLIKDPLLADFLQRISKKERELYVVSHSFTAEGLTLKMVKLTGKEPAQGGLFSVLFGCLLWIVKCRQDFLAQPTDTELLHQFRISMREFRSILSFGKPLFSEDVYSVRQAWLKNYGQMLAELRELDVLIEAWQEILTCRNLKFSNLQILSDILHKNRRDRQRQITTLLERSTIVDTFQEFWPWLIYRQQAVATTSSLSLEEFLAGRLTSWLKKHAVLFKKADLQDRAALHDLRIHGKKIRYALERFQPLLAEKFIKRLKKLKTIQSQLGEIHDSYRNSEFVYRLASEHKLPDLYYAAGIFTGWQEARVAGVRQELSLEQKK